MRISVILTALALSIGATTANAAEFLFMRVSKAYVAADNRDGRINFTPKDTAETLRAKGMATEEDLKDGFVLAYGLKIPSLIGARPQNHGVYVPPEFRKDVKEGTLVLMEVSDRLGALGFIGLRRWQVVRQVFTPDANPELYAKCSDVYEVHNCMEKMLGKAEGRIAPLEAPHDSAATSPARPASDSTNAN